MVTEGRGRSGAEKGINRFKKCRCSEIITENVLVEGS
jgi:hypothetical protein